MKCRNIFLAAVLAGLMGLSPAVGWAAQAAEQIQVEEITEVEEITDTEEITGMEETTDTEETTGMEEITETEVTTEMEEITEAEVTTGTEALRSGTHSGSSRTEAAAKSIKKVKKFQMDETKLPKLYLKGLTELKRRGQTGATAGESESDAETESTTFSQGLYEIVSATNIYFLMDVKHCTVQESDSRTVQTFRSLDVNQQKFYIEKLPDDLWRISAVHSGEAFTAAADDASFSLAPMEHPENTEAADSQSWRLQNAGEGFFYIQSPGGNYVTLDAGEAYNGAAVVLREFTGGRNQKWLLSRTWISGNDIADTDLTNPYSEDGPCRNLSITLKFGRALETLTRDDLAAHTSENESHQYVLDPEFLNSYVSQLAAKYDTQGQPRRFMTSNDSEITLTEGDFGWKLDTEGTKALIRENLLADSAVTLEPVWSHKGGSFSTQDGSINDIGSSYVEVDLTRQKVWVYKNGRCLLESDCVSGTMGTGAQTPSGVYGIYYMQSPAVLNGPGYSSPVTYWMAFYGGFGIHDATWRTEFGGEIFRSDGSHGCVNLPLESAEVVYNTVQIGYPVVLYY